ncbi:MAG: cell envelope biogenesis protein TolA, partial [Sphingomicrobium sp.]
EVELVDEVGLHSAATAAIAAPPSPSQAPEQAQDIAPAPPQSSPIPQSAPMPQVTPAPQPRLASNSLAAQVAELKPAPARAAPVKLAPQQAAPARPSPAAPTRPRASRIGADFLKGIADAPPSAAPAKSAAPAISASAMAGIQQAIRRQIQPCADRQVNPGPGASRIRVTLHLALSRSGRLTSPPQVVRTSGVDEDNARYEERVKDLAVSIISGCAPLTGLPQDLYQTANGGWSNFNMTYSLP